MILISQDTIHNLCHTIAYIQLKSIYDNVSGNSMS